VATPRRPRFVPGGPRSKLADLERLLRDDDAANGRQSGTNVKVAFRHLRERFTADCRARDITSAVVEQYKAARLAAGVRTATANSGASTSGA
jgi:hypothetical protein